MKYRVWIELSKLNKSDNQHKSDNGLKLLSFAKNYKLRSAILKNKQSVRSANVGE